MPLNRYGYRVVNDYNLFGFSPSLITKLKGFKVDSRSGMTAAIKTFLAEDLVTAIVSIPLSRSVGGSPVPSLSMVTG